MKIICISDENKEGLNKIKGDLMRKHASDNITWDYVLDLLIGLYDRGGNHDKKRIQKD